MTTKMIMAITKTTTKTTKTTPTFAFNTVTQNTKL